MPGSRSTRHGLSMLPPSTFTGSRVISLSARKHLCRRGARQAQKDRQANQAATEAEITQA
jgi:hypothetical protein